MIVVDIGCATYGGESSIDFLVEQFQPHTLYGFDPAVKNRMYMKARTRVVTRSAAAWTHSGLVPFTEAGTCGKVGVGPQVECFDLVTFLRLLDDGEVVLKIDAEGSEYELLPHLIAHDSDALLSLAWVEWHCPDCGRGGGGHRPGCDTVYSELVDDLEGRLRCETRRWDR